MGYCNPAAKVCFWTVLPEKQGTAQTLFGVAAPSGSIASSRCWAAGWSSTTTGRWIFYVNVPVGLLPLAVNWLVVQDPEYLKKQCPDIPRRQPLNFDAIGLGLLALLLASWEITLSKGQEWDWLGDQLANPDAGDDHGGGHEPAGARSEAENQEPDRQFPRPPRPEPCRVLRPYFLRLCRALRRQFFAAATATDLVRLDVPLAAAGCLPRALPRSRG